MVRECWTANEKIVSISSTGFSGRKRNLRHLGAKMRPIRPVGKKLQKQLCQSRWVIIVNRPSQGMPYLCNYTKPGYVNYLQMQNMSAVNTSYINIVLDKSEQYLIVKSTREIEPISVNTQFSLVPCYCYTDCPCKPLVIYLSQTSTYKPLISPSGQICWS